MAELSDADKRILLGENYKEEAEARRVRSGLSDEAFASRERDAKYAGVHNAALYIGVIAVIIFLANYFATAFPYSSSLAFFAAGAFVVAVAAGVWARSKRSGAPAP